MSGGRMNWRRVADRRRMRRQGVEDIQGGTSIRIPQQRPHIIAMPRTKAEFCREAARAFMAANKEFLQSRDRSRRRRARHHMKDERK
jgi:hypothetical protein